MKTSNIITMRNDDSGGFLIGNCWRFVLIKHVSINEGHLTVFVLAKLRFFKQFDEIGAHLMKFNEN